MPIDDTHKPPSLDSVEKNLPKGEAFGLSKNRTVDGLAVQKQIREGWADASKELAAAGMSAEDRKWLDMAQVGREFGSPDYERLTRLDAAADVKPAGKEKP